MTLFTRIAQNWPWLLVTIIVLTISFYVDKLLRHRRKYANLPTPPYDKFWGNLKVMGEFVKKYPSNIYLARVLSDIADTYELEDLYYLDIAPFAEPFLVLTNPELALQVQASDQFDRAPLVINFLGGLVGTDGIFATTGKEWQEARQWFAPAFSMSNILTLVPGMVEEVLVFRENLTKLAVSGETFPLHEVLTRLTIDIIGHAVGGFRLKSQSTYSTVQDTFRKAVHWSVGQGDPTWMRILRPIMQPWYTRTLDSLLIPMIKQKFAENSDVAGKSILGLARKGYMKHRASQRQSKQEQIDDDKKFLKVALDNAKTFFTAGHDTTSSTFTYVFYLLTIHPEILARVRKEHDDVLGHDLETTINNLINSPQLLNQLPLTAAVVKETLRLFPIGFTVRKSVPGATITWKGREYPTENHLVAVLSHQMQRNPENFSDPLKFDPDRWLDSDREEPGKDNGAWQPFERGHRNCIGQQFSLIESRVIAALTLRYFDFETRFDKNVPSLPGWGDQAFQIFKLTAKPQDGLPVIVKLRES